MVLDMGVEDEETPMILERPFLSTTNAVIYIGSRQVHFNFQMERYAVTLIIILIMNRPTRTAIGGDIDPTVKQPSP
jgi:hypothetical protein